MAREVAVKLTLDTKDVVKGAAETKVAFEAVDKQVHSLDREITETEHDMGTFTVAAVAAKREVGSLGNAAAKSAVEVKGLDERIKEARLEVGRMSTQFARSGTDIDRKNIQDAKRLLSTLERTRRDILAFASSDEIEQAGIVVAQDVAKTVSTGVKEGFKFSLRGLLEQPELLAVLAGAALSLAPPLGAAIAGAVVGAVGLGGIVGGVISAAKDPRVTDAFAQFKADIAADFFGGAGAGAFVQPILDSLHTLSEGFKSLNLGATFAKAAPSLNMLATGVVNLFKNAMPGFNEVMEQSKPIVAELARGLGEIGSAFSQFLHELINSKGALLGLRTLFELISGTLVGLGKVLGALGNAFQYLANFILGFADAVSKMHLPGVSDAAGKVRDRIKELTSGLGDFSMQADDAGQSTVYLSKSAAQLAVGLDNSAAAAAQERTMLQQMTTALDAATQGSLDLWQAQLDASQALADASRALHDNGRHWNDNTDAARNNQRAIKDAITALIQQRDAAIANSDGTKAARDKIIKAYDDQIDKLKRLASQMGATKAQADALAGTYKVQFSVSVSGIGSLTRLNDLAHQHYGGAAGFASGTGYAPAGMPYLAGEQGPELIFPLVPTKVLNHPQTMAYAGGTGGMTAGGAMNYYTINLTMAPGADQREAGRQIVAAITYYEQANGKRWRS